MQSIRQVFTGMLLALISIAVVVGGFTLATAEKTGPTSPTIQATQPVLLNLPTEAAGQMDPPLPLPELPNATQEILTAETATPTQLVTNTIPAATITSMPSATMVTLATNLPTVTSLPSLTPGSFFDTPYPTSTFGPSATAIACGAPAWWINYIVISGDTLYSISLRYGVTVYELQVANCLGTSVYLQVGKILKVPNVATNPPYLSPTPYIYPTDVPPATDIPTLTPEPPTIEPPTIEPPTSEPPPIETPTPTPFSGVG
jgi:hypothetical protein